MSDPPGPQFVGVGQMKAGTSWLFDQLDGHPDVWMPRFKELHYFDVGVKFRVAEAAFHDLIRTDPADSSGLMTHPVPPWHQEPDPDRLRRDLEFFRRLLFTAEARKARRRTRDIRAGTAPIRRRHAEWYLGLFPADDVVAGEITPAYGTLDESRIRAMARWMPQTRFILLVRHPVDRARSHLGHLVTSGRVPTSALVDPDRTAAVLVEHPQIVRKSDAAAIAATWQAVVGDRLLVQQFSDIKAEPQRVRAAVASFLGIRSDPELFSRNAGFNRKAPTRRSASAEVADYLGETLKTESRAFEAEFPSGPTREPA